MQIVKTLPNTDVIDASKVTSDTFKFYVHIIDNKVYFLQSDRKDNDTQYYLRSLSNFIHLYIDRTCLRNNFNDTLKLCVSPLNGIKSYGFNTLEEFCKKALEEKWEV